MDQENMAPDSSVDEDLDQFATKVELVGDTALVYALRGCPDATPLFPYLHKIRSVQFMLQKQSISIPRIVLAAHKLPDLRNFTFCLLNVPTSFEDSIDEFWSLGLIKVHPEVNKVRIISELTTFSTMEIIEKRRAIRLCVGLLRAVGNAFVNTKKLELVLPYDTWQGDVLHEAVHDLLQALDLIPNNLPVLVETLADGEQQLRCTFG